MSPAILAETPPAGAFSLEELAADVARAKVARDAGDQAEMRRALVLAAARVEVMLGPGMRRDPMA